MIAETLSLVASDFRIFSAGTYWDINKFTNRTLFAPFAYRKIDGTDHASRKFKIEDLARLNKPGELGTQTLDYFTDLNPKPASSKKLSPIFLCMNNLLVPGNTKINQRNG